MPTIAMTHPPGYLEHESRTNSIYSVAITMYTLAVIVVSLRIYARSYVTRFLGPDDYWIIASMISSTAEFCIKIAWLRHGFGRHWWNLTQNQLQINVKLTYAIQALYPFSLGLAKLSILTFYLRLFPYENLRKICHAGRIMLACMTISISLSVLLACKPIKYGWSLHPEGHCISKADIQFAASSLNLFTDIIILLLPIKYIWALSTDKKKKFACLGLFSLGLVTCVASAIRISAIAVFYRSSDPSWTGSRITMWSAIECNLAIITPSIPACYPLFKVVFNRILSEGLFSGKGETKHEINYAKSSTTQAWPTLSTVPESLEL